MNVGYTGQGNYSNYSSTVELGEWYYGAVTRNAAANGSGVLNFYDKTGLTNTVSSQNITTTWGTQNCIIGGTPGFMDGDIALVRVYKRELSANEVSNNFEAIRGRYGL